MKKFNLIFASVLMLMLMSACGQGYKTGDTGPAGPQGPAAPAPIMPTLPAVDPIAADIAALLADENTYRLELGQTQLSAGLSCTVQAVSSGQWLSSSSPGYNAGQGVLVMTGSSYPYLYQGSFNQPNASSGPNNLLPTAIQPMFVGNNYKISCSGQIVVTTDGYYSFDLNSDDGSILTVNGTQVVNNDGNHGLTDKNGSMFLRRGVRPFSILYAQSGAGSFGLIIQANGSLIDPKYYAH